MNHQYFPTPLLDAALARQRFTNELGRQRLLQGVQGWVVAHAVEYGFESGYLFGSITKIERFTQGSDIDIAVETFKQGEPFRLMGDLSLFLGREIDLVPLDRCHFAEQVRQLGVTWNTNVLPDSALS